ncbi:MAG: exodeoxyribonuclease V subunit gamma [Lachnospiraceae bacterium]|nr:exodeoxyribonuclease V subunit gamma [Lachnospiraceae bacterium]
MALQFVLGGSGSGKSEYVRKKAIDIALSDRKNGVLMIVPDQFTMQTQWAMANAHPDGGILNIDVLSFSRLPRKVFEEVGQPKRILLDDTGKCLLIKRGATKIKDDLHVLSRGMDNAGWAAEVKSVISEFMQYDVKPSDLDKYIELCDVNLRNKLSDLKLLYEAFLKECEEKYITNEGLLDMFIERIPLSKKLEGSVLIFDGFTGFTPIQIKTVAALLEKAKDVIITFPFENDINENPRKIIESNYLFDLTKRNIADLIKECDARRIEVKNDVRLIQNHRHANSPELAYLEKNLFRAEAPKAESNGAIQIFKCTDIENECHNLCHAVLKEIEEKDLRYRDVAVVCADMARYQNTLAKFLERYKIPYYMDSNRSIMGNPLVKYILSITDILRNNFKQDDVMKFLRTGISPLEDEQIDRLENYIYARGIKGISKWRIPFMYPSEEMVDNDEPLDHINSVREEFTDVFADITGGGIRKRKLRVWLEEIYNIIDKGEAAEKLAEKSDELKEEGRIEESLEYASIYDKVMEIFDALIELMGEEDFTIRELSDILKVAFSEIRFGVLPQRVDSLLVGDMQRTRLKEIKALFILGVNDGNIPNSGVSGGLLSLPDKEELKRLECRLAPTSDELAFIEQLYIYLNLTKPTDKLYLSYATIGAQGETMIPSYLIDVLKNMYNNLKPVPVKKEPRLFLSDIKEEAGKLIGFYAAGHADKDQEKLLFDDIRILKNHGEEEWCKKVIENAFREYVHKPLESETAKKLYGDMLSVSVSTLEQFAKCQYSHFAGYGLNLSQREEYGLDSIDMGNLAHDVLEVVGKELKEDDKDFSEVESAPAQKAVDSAIEKLINEYNGDILKSDEKTKYYAKQLSRIMKRTVKTLGFQLSKGKFKPDEYEMRFRKMYDLADSKSRVVLKGRVDRTDVYDDSNGNRYVKIIDYKSSEHKFTKEGIDDGTTLQLPIYMKNTIEALKVKYPNDNILPAAMLYYAIDDPFTDDEKNSEEAIRKELIPTGSIVNDEKIIQSLDETLNEGGVRSEVIPVKTNKDGSASKASSVLTPEEFNKLLDKAEAKALSLSEEILSGAIEINPLRNSKETACKYCAYNGICGFDERIDGYEYRSVVSDNPESDNNESEA